MYDYEIALDAIEDAIENRKLHSYTFDQGLIEARKIVKEYKKQALKDKGGK